MLIHIVDVSGSEGRDPKEDFRIINEELRKFNPDLANRPMLVAGNKCDLTTDEQVEDFRKFVEAQGYEFFPIKLQKCFPRCRRSRISSRNRSR